MAVKTITIDLEAYELLRRRKNLGDSFSDVIKEQFGRREPRTVGRLLAKLPAAALGEDALDAIDAIIADRGRSVPVVPELTGAAPTVRERPMGKRRSSGGGRPRSRRGRA
ncbi:MAG: antitoxin VapB family protein [Acidobacteria bacterium]|nr:antitoxin VapB family protein [Acidobacteriota bacterium]